MPINKALVVYFSGTGGTARAADAMEAALVSRGINVSKQEIHHNNVFTNGDEDLLVLLFAVHALNAPEPVYRWLESMTTVTGISAAVLSVSGGGEVFPNRACRVSSIKRLKNKGYDVTYEDMLVMPSNMSASTPDSLSVRLLKVLPQKAQTIADDLLAGVTRHVKPGLLNRFMSVLGEGEKYGAHSFGKVLHANEKLHGLRLVREAMPERQHQHDGQDPEFDGKCVMCFRCVYGCPMDAIKAKHMGFVLNKQGFDMKRFDTLEAAPDKKAKGVAWKGVNKYLDGNGKKCISDENRTVPRG